jgi:hypothetical protein
MAHTEYRRPVNGVLIHDDLKDIDHILFAQFESVLRLGRYLGSLLGGGLGLSEDGGQPERRAIGAQPAIAEGRDQNAAVLFG